MPGALTSPPLTPELLVGPEHEVVFVRERHLHTLNSLEHPLCVYS